MGIGRSVRPASEVVSATSAPKCSRISRARTAASPVPASRRTRQGAVGNRRVGGALWSGMTDQAPIPVEHRNVNRNGAGEGGERDLARLGGDEARKPVRTVAPGAPRDRQHLAGADSRGGGRGARSRRAGLGGTLGGPAEVEPP